MNGGGRRDVLQEEEGEERQHNKTQRKVGTDKAPQRGRVEDGRDMKHECDLCGRNVSRAGKLWRIYKSGMRVYMCKACRRRSLRQDFIA